MHQEFPWMADLRRERRVGDHEIESSDRIAVNESGLGQTVAVSDDSHWLAIDDHVHPGQAGQAAVQLLAEHVYFASRFLRHLEKERASAAGGIVNRNRTACLHALDPNDLRNNPRNHRVSAEFAKTTTLVPHEVREEPLERFRGICSVFRKLEIQTLEDADEVGKAVYHFPPRAQLVGVVEIRKIVMRQLVVSIDQRSNDPLIDLRADTD